uniref:Deacetylase sirtuin-type domain-containing protein n=1 Tax=viral metagenome TaxID=1070528 RepID=A0A6C0J8F8_9ZZZZ
MGQVKSTILHQRHRKIYSLDVISKKIQKGKYKNIIVMCGAGISKSAGFPDFRTPSIGIYSKLQKYNLPSPEAIINIDYFKSNPEPFYSLVRELFPKNPHPTQTHKFLSLLDQKGFLKRVYTQNIDSLEHASGLDSNKIVEAHGTINRSYCIECNKSYSLSWLYKEILNPNSNEGVPKCQDCFGIVRPDIVFFNEELPKRFWDMAEKDFPECDLLLIFGTSLSVAPFCELVTQLKKNTPRIFINQTKPGSVGCVERVLGVNTTVKFDRKNDIIVLGDCDDIVVSMCKTNKWEDDLNNIKTTPLHNL